MAKQQRKKSLTQLYWPISFCFQGFIALNGFEPMKLDSLKKDGQPIVWTIEFVDKFMLVSYFKMAPGKSSGFSKIPFGMCFQFVGYYGSPEASGYVIGTFNSGIILIVL